VYALSAREGIATIAQGIFFTEPLKEMAGESQFEHEVLPSMIQRIAKPGIHSRQFFKCGRGACRGTECPSHIEFSRAGLSGMWEARSVAAIPVL
jgi:hypothetical protein